MAVAAVLLAYLIGSISFAVLVCRVMGVQDPRTFGSKNPGATNVLRSGRKTAAVLTLLGDCGKGWVAVALATHVFAGSAGVATVLAMVGVAVVVGHMFPVFLRFQGGKGVSTALGMLLALDWRLGVATLVTWIIIAIFFRFASLASMIAAVFAVFACALIHGMHVFTAAAGFVALLVVWRHKSNISNLIAGTEGRIGSKQA